MRTRFWMAVLTAAMIGLSGCGDKTKTEENGDGGNGGGTDGGGSGGSGGTSGGGASGGKSFSLTIVAHPARALQSPLAANIKDMPEVKMAEQELGINLSEVERVKVLIGPDLEGGINGAPVRLAAMFSFTKDVKDALNAKMVDQLKMQDITPQEKTHSGTTYSTFTPPQGDGPPTVAWYFPDGKSMVVSTEDGLQKYISEGGASNADNVLQAGGMDADFIVAGKKPDNYEAVIRKFIEFAKQQGAPAEEAKKIEDAIPQLKEFLEPLDTVYLSADLSGKEGATLLKIDVGVKTAEDATKLFEVMNGGVGMAKFGYGMAKEQLKQALEPDKAEAQLKPIDDLINSLKVTQNGTHVVAEAKTPAGFVQFIEEVAPKLMGGVLQNFGPPGGGFPGGGAEAIPRTPGGVDNPPPQ